MPRMQDLSHTVSGEAHLGKHDAEEKKKDKKDKKDKKAKGGKKEKDRDP